MNEPRVAIDIDNARSKINMERYDFSLGELMSLYEQGELDLNPGNRPFTWDEQKMTRFIESALLGLPMPLILLAINEDGAWNVVDGLQRLTTVFTFLGKLKGLGYPNGWSLVKGDIIKSLDRYNAKCLPQKYLLLIRRAICRVNLISSYGEIDTDLIYERLNQGGGDG